MQVSSGGATEVMRQDQTRLQQVLINTRESATSEAAQSIEDKETRDLFNELDQSQ